MDQAYEGEGALKEQELTSINTPVNKKSHSLSISGPKDANLQKLVSETIL
jgi:hypothetical protein